jgi:hypothetical protein
VIEIREGVVAIGGDYHDVEVRATRSPDGHVVLSLQGTVDDFQASICFESGEDAMSLAGQLANRADVALQCGRGSQ